MGRRVVALIGILVLVALALTLLWWVYVHHLRAVPLDPDLLIENVSASTTPVGSFAHVAPG